MLTLKKNYATLKSSDSELYELTDEDISKMHEVILSIYNDLMRVCKKYSLKMIAGGGSCLGTVRHKGFIPWDDDMDLNMPRRDYEKLKKVFEKELGDKYYLLAPGYKDGCNCFLMRIMKKNTTLLNMIDEAAPYPTGIYIDITPIDYAPDNYLALRAKGFAADVLRFISYSVYWKQYRSPSLKRFMLSSEGKTYYKIRILTGTVFSFLSAEKWFEIFDRFIKSRKTHHVTVAAGREKYVGAYYHVNDFYPVKTMPFEDTQMNVVRNYKKYLKRLYGDYMKIPEKADREKHLCLELSFEKERK